MNWLVDSVGGSFYVTHRENDRHRECLKWQISGTNVMKLLEAMRPHVRIKKDQVEFVLNEDSRNEKGLKHLQDLKWGRV